MLQCVAVRGSMLHSKCSSLYKTWQKEPRARYLVYIHICVGYGYRDSLLRPVCCIVLQCVLQRMLQ